MKKKTPLMVAREKNELAKLTLDTAIRERKAAIVSKYDATESNVMRRQPEVETKSEDQIYDQSKRQYGNNIGRDLERNYAPARGILHQFRMNVVGELGKLQVNTDGGKEASDWFNGVWAKDPDFRDDVPWSTILQNVVAGVLREGDLLAVVDDGLIENTGKVIHWESDQIVSLGQGEFDKTQFKNGTQENGIIRGKHGKVEAYIVTGKRGQQVINDITEATIWTRGNARLVKNPWRLNQGRGIPALLTNATNFLDLYEILAAELQSAKRAAVIAGFTKRTNAETNWDTPATMPENLPENMGKATTTTDLEQANGTEPTTKNYERFEKLTGGYWEYLEDGDEVGFPDLNRPNVNLAAFIEAVLGHAGAAMGLARAYTILRADSSYTAFRGDMILSWVTFYAMQKWLERTYADWVARKVLTWAMREGHVKTLKAGWENSLSWKWPTMPHVDEAREAIAEAQGLKNGTLDYSDLLGPDWMARFTAFSEQLKAARELELPLSVFEQKSGGAAPSESKGDANA